MYCHIETLKKRLDEINQLRIDRALVSMAPSFQDVYSLIPILLHFHHPMLPGYLEGSVPHGICFYSPDATNLAWFDNIDRVAGVRVSSLDSDEQPITGVYSMGSISSIGQNANSDLDIWVCHQSWLDNKDCIQLQQKFRILEKWARCQGVNVSFFLIDENRFRHKNNCSLGEKQYASTQNILLLDEFYRTAVRMGGKRVLWNMVPGDEEAHYDEYVLSLYARGVLTPNEWVDLGGLGTTISLKEYFGTSLWLLYKSIDSPYKAVLKTLLLEAYSWEYPHTELLAMKIKQRLHDGEIISFGLDPYCILLERLTYYLTQISDTTRLDMVCRCFYLKASEKLSQDPGRSIPWRREILTQLVTSWGWDKVRLEMLDNRANWKIGQVRDAHNELLSVMIESYHNLIRFSHRNNLTISANLQEIGLLTNNLYAAAEIAPCKMNMITS